MYVHEAVAKALADLGTDTMFGLIGDANLFMVNSFVDQQAGRYVSAVHEASAVMMALGYASRTGRIGVSTVTQGPGLSNTATSLIEAVRSRSPIVVVVGDTAPSNTLNQQSLDQQRFVEGTGARYVVATAAEDAVAAVQRGVSLATQESCPVVVNIPTEFQWSVVDYAFTPPTSTGPTGPSAPEVSEDVLNEAVGVIASARRPLVLAGAGTVGAPQRAAVLEFAQRIGAPIVTTLQARELYSAADGSLGICGTLTNDLGGQVIADSDCVIVFGASLNTWTTVQNTILTGKALVHVDVDPTKLDRNMKATVAVHGDCAEVARTFIEWLDAGSIPASPFRGRVTAGVTDESLRFTYTDTSGALTIGAVLSAVDQVLPPQRTVIFDGGRFMGEAFKYINSDWQRQILSTAFGAVGMGMGAAIGAASAALDEPAILITGDGGFMMNGLAELNSAVRANIPLIVVICNDRSYGAEYDQYVNRDVPTKLSIFDWPDFAPVAAALGADGYTIRGLGDVDAAIAAIKNPVRPVVIDIQIDVDAIPEVPH
jgi:acetolactate synthase-1/2/3 large subunit